MQRIDRRALRGFERLACSLLDGINQNHAVKDRLHGTIGWANAWWIDRFTSNVWHVTGAEHLEGLDAPRGIVVAANHRSFFDLYVCSSWLMTRQPDKVKRLFFPVRAKYFYTHPVGALMNIGLSAGSMWPPIFRDHERRDLNRVSMNQLAEVMVPGSLVGIHPEGKRGTGDDPWALLPAKPGLGVLLEACHPDTLVLPYFTLGLENSLAALLKRNRKPEGERGETVRMRFGQTLRAGDVLQDSPRETTEFVMDAIRELAEVDRSEFA